MKSTDISEEQVKDTIFRIINERLLPQVVLDNGSLSLSPGPSGIGIDSMGFLQLMLAIEETFGVEISDDKWSYASFKTLQMVIDYIVQALDKMN